MKPLALLPLALLLPAVYGGARLAPRRAQEQPEDVSLIRLIATPERYHGKTVRVIGFVHLEFEDFGVYVHEDDVRHGISKNGLWLENFKTPEPILPKRPIPRRVNDKYVIIEGRFDMNDHGHFGGWSGAITDITRFSPWSDPKKPRRDR